MSHIPAHVTDFLFVCPLSRKSSWQLRLKRTSLPIWVSSTSSLGRETHRPPLLPGWMISCAHLSVYPICLLFCGCPMIHFKQLLIPIQFCVVAVYIPCVRIIHNSAFCLLVSKHSPTPFMACLSLKCCSHWQDT